MYSYEDRIWVVAEACQHALGKTADEQSDVGSWSIAPFKRMCKRSMGSCQSPEAGSRCRAQLQIRFTAMPAFRDVSR